MRTFGDKHVADDDCAGTCIRARACIRHGRCPRGRLCPFAAAAQGVVDVKIVAVRATSSSRVGTAVAATNEERASPLDDGLVGLPLGRHDRPMTLADERVAHVGAVLDRLDMGGPHVEAWVLIPGLDPRLDVAVEPKAHVGLRRPFERLRRRPGPRYLSSRRPEVRTGGRSGLRPLRR
jgi:hypothetical protein